MHQATALFDYQNEQNEEGYLKFSKEDKLTIQMFYENGWAYGFKTEEPGTQGYIPVNFIQLQME